MVAAAAQFHDAAIALAEAFRTQQTGPVSAEVLTEMLAAVRQGELVTCLAIEVTDRSGEFACDGAGSATAYVRSLANETRPWASMRVNLGRALADYLPATRAAWEAGHLGFSHAWEIYRATKDLTDPDLVASLDRIFAEATPALSPKDLKNLADRVLAQEAPEAAAKKTADQRAAQKLTVSQTMNGMWDLHARLGAEAGTLINNVIDAFTPKPTQEEVLADPAGSMSPAELRAQALAEICRQAQQYSEGCNGKGGGHGTLIAVVPLKDLQTGIGTGDVAGGATLPAAALRRWACDIGIIPMVLGSDSQILDYGTKTRAISPGLWSFLVARDGGCVFPGCDRPPAWTEAHHRIHWLVGGPTSKINLDLLCVQHHHACHEGGWTIRIAEDLQRDTVVLPTRWPSSTRGKTQTPHPHPQTENRPATTERTQQAESDISRISDSESHCWNSPAESGL